MDKFKDVTMAQVALLVACIAAVVAAHFFAAGLTPTVMSLTAVVVMAFVRKFGDPPPPAPPASPVVPDPTSKPTPGLAFRALAFAALAIVAACATVTAPNAGDLVKHADKLLTCENQARAAADAAQDGAAGAETWAACKSEAGIQ